MKSIKKELVYSYIINKSEFISVIRYLDNTDEAMEYAERCAAHFNKLDTNQPLLEEIQNKIAKFMLYMYEEWNGNL